MSRVWTALSAILLLVAWTRTTSLEPHRERGVLPIDPPTPYFRYVPEESPRGRMLVVHGLDVSKELMQLLCAAFADGGFDVYAIDLPGHGDSTARFDASRARNVVAQALDKLRPIDVAVGHSLGGGLLLDVAADRPVPRMILLSPAPTPLADIDFHNTLVVSGAFDIAAIDAFIPKLEGAEWWRNPWGAHATAVFHPAQARDMVRWLGGNVDEVHATSRLVWNLLLVSSAIAFGLSLLSRTQYPVPTPHFGIDRAAVWFILAGAVTAVILRLFPFANWLHLYATGYMIGFFLLTGVILCGAADKTSRRVKTAAGSVRGVAIAIAAAAYVVAVVGFLGVSHLAHMTLSDGRWWRFAVITLASFPLFYFDESSLRTGPGWKTAVTGILSRVVLGACILSGALTLNPDSGFLALVMHFVVVFWIALWFATDAVRRHTQEPVAAAVFASLVQGWILAAWVVLT